MLLSLTTLFTVRQIELSSTRHIWPSYRYFAAKTRKSNGLSPLLVGWTGFQPVYASSASSRSSHLPALPYSSRLLPWPDPTYGSNATHNSRQSHSRVQPFARHQAASSKQLVSIAVAVAVAVAVGFDVGVAVNVAACMPKHLHFIHESSALSSYFCCCCSTIVVVAVFCGVFRLF